MRDSPYAAQTAAASIPRAADRTAPSAPDAARSRPRVLGVLLAGLGILIAVAGWHERVAPLRWLGAALVHEDPVRPSDVAIVSVASARGAALDAAKLYRRGLVREVWVTSWVADRVDRRLDERGLGTPPTHEVSRRILEGSGVPASRIVVLDPPVDGLESEMAVVGAALRARPGTRSIVLTARSHTARARSLLRDVYAPAAGARVRAPKTDEFRPGAWWRDHGSMRELTLECLKWVKLLATGASARSG